MPYFFTKSVYQGNLKNVTFTVNGNQTSRALVFAVKKERTDKTRLLTLRNETAGGNSSQITVTYDAGNNKSTITVKLMPMHTLILHDFEYYYDINASSGTSDPEQLDTVTLVWGLLYVEPAVQKLYDIPASGGEMDYISQTHDAYLSLEINNDGTGAKVLELGWEAGEVSFEKLTTGKYRVLTTEELFDTASRRFDVQLLSVDNDDFTVFPIIKHDIVSGNTIEFALYDVNSQLNVDADFRVIIKRIRE